jgi:hypothetical protein
MRKIGGNKMKYTINVILAVIFLFIFYLYSGGIYHYNDRAPRIRYNKITGEMQGYYSHTGEWKRYRP